MACTLVCLLRPSVQFVMDKMAKFLATVKKTGRQIESNYGQARTSDGAVVFSFRKSGIIYLLLSTPSVSL